jgi:hypothetical protein
MKSRLLIRKCVKYLILIFKKVLFKVYYLSLMPYIQRDKYFTLMSNESDIIIITNIK